MVRLWLRFVIWRGLNLSLFDILWNYYHKDPSFPVGPQVPEVKYQRYHKYHGSLIMETLWKRKWRAFQWKVVKCKFSQLSSMYINALYIRVCYIKLYWRRRSVRITLTNERSRWQSTVKFHWFIIQRFSCDLICLFVNQVLRKW